MFILPIVFIPLTPLLLDLHALLVGPMFRSEWSYNRINPVGCLPPYLDNNHNDFLVFLHEVEAP